MSCLDVLPQIRNRNVFWAVWTFLPDALVNSFDVILQMLLSELLGAEWAFLADTFMILLDVG